MPASRLRACASTTADPQGPDEPWALDLWGVTARSKQLHTDKVLHGTIKTAVVGRQRYKGTEVNTLDCINIKRNKG